ncbi:MAG: NADPH-dependent 7-cyano-7-deazaguanine reductase QueF [Gammaproteobacteria bacterium]|nr:NADPH-dependent 7-cyano-7-deazaguanine reductase QueF [Gammaproteobacteria bacterium]
MADETVVRGNPEKKKYVTTYKPSLLSSVARKDQRESLGITEDALPFRGIDTWNGWEFSWLNQKGKPEVAVLTFEVPSKSPHLIESKSLKLYLGSYSGTKFGYRAEVISTLESDLTVAAQAPVNVMLQTPEQIHSKGVGVVNGTSLDSQDIEITDYFWDPEYLTAEGSTIVRESLFTHLFKSLCPITGQPDFATVHIQYSGRMISHAGLLRYLVSYRNHEEFAEQIT